MKKFVIVSCIWFSLLLTVVVCNSKTELHYIIYYDSKEQETFELKDRIQETYSELVSGVHADSYRTMLLRNTKKFEYDKTIKVNFSNNCLTITQGDGKGDEIKGELVTSVVCLPKVQPRSFIQELLSK